jgi:hypothetical protein
LASGKFKNKVVVGKALACFFMLIDTVLNAEKKQGEKGKRA